jgi:hypothetical protein
MDYISQKKIDSWLSKKLKSAAAGRNAGSVQGRAPCVNRSDSNGLEHFRNHKRF